jgi:extradiol dioxygenase family protein
MYGHQLVIHYQAPSNHDVPAGNEVDGHSVPVPHFGVVLSMEDWRTLAEKLRQKGVEFIIEPYIRFEGQIGEQATMFFLDPCGNALEFKAFEDLSGLFEK